MKNNNKNKEEQVGLTSRKRAPEDILDVVANRSGVMRSAGMTSLSLCLCPAEISEPIMSKLVSPALSVLVSLDRDALLAFRSTKYTTAH